MNFKKLTVFVLATLVANTIYCFFPFGSKKRADYYATMYQITDTDQKEFLKAIQDKDRPKVERFLNNKDFIQNASDSLFNAARHVAEEAGNKQLAERIWIIQNQ